MVSVLGHNIQNYNFWWGQETQGEAGKASTAGNVNPADSAAAKMYAQSGL